MVEESTRKFIRDSMLIGTLVGLIGFGLKCPNDRLTGYDCMGRKIEQPRQGQTQVSNYSPPSYDKQRIR